MKKICEYYLKACFGYYVTKPVEKGRSTRKKKTKKKNAVEETEDSSVTELSPSWNNC
jgi:hypothetical protein